MSGNGSNGLIDDCILDGIDCALEARDDLGAIKAKVYIVTRVWSGDQVGRGDYTDTSKQVYPSPEIVDFSHDLRVKEGGTVKSGDILLKSISRKRYSEYDLDLSIADNQRYIEKFYCICDKLYEVVNVKMQYATWDVLIRRISVQNPVDSELSNGGLDEVIT